MRIAVDIMSGDNAPKAVVEGAVMAAEKDNFDIVLVGDSDTANRILAGRGADRISVHHAVDVIGMCDPPASVLKEKSGSSMAVAIKLLNEGSVDAVVSAGNTGALFTAACITVRRINGIRRAALGTIIRLRNPVMMLDMGANLDSTPEILDLYGRMGSIYVSRVLGIEKPRVALLNNGAEEIKGTELYRSAYTLMKNDKTINFVGNCEGNMISRNVCDVLVCDGFAGNICLKTMEGTSTFIMQQIKGMFTSSLSGNIAALVMGNRIAKLKESLSSKKYGGAPILGIKKPVIKAHGNSDAVAIAAAIRQAKQYAESRVIETIQSKLSKVGGECNE